MATSRGGTEEGTKTLKEGERILAPTRRPDGTYRKPIRIRAGYTPQDEVAIYQSKGALLKKGMGGTEVPPGYDPTSDVKPKTKSAKRNERKKEKKEQGKSSESLEAKETSTGEVTASEDLGLRSEAVESIACQMNKLDVSTNSPDLTINSEAPSQDIDKKIRALKKKIRQIEAQLQKTERDAMNQEQLDKVAKLEGWQQELKVLEDKKAEQSTS
ncbi:partner of Y14 and mago-like [Papaver somniferum]|uniref:partner of Y14 and mago-like n=1 Tax=Papaver somniferum TaxID=3469 RepID=UPI000E6F72EB|nr:partner of Y14 and mago-like [Papaver somniferum]